MSNDVNGYYNQLKAINASLKPAFSHDRTSAVKVSALNAIIHSLHDLLQDDAYNNWIFKDGSVDTSNYNDAVVQATRYTFDEHKRQLRPDNRLEPLTYLDKITQPGNGGPTTHVSQTNQQTQSTDVNVEVNQAVHQILETLVEKQHEYEPGTPERTFIDKLKPLLAGVKDVRELIGLILATSANSGLAIEQLHSLLG